MTPSGAYGRVRSKETGVSLSCQRDSESFVLEVKSRTSPDIHAHGPTIHRNFGPEVRQTLFSGGVPTGILQAIYRRKVPNVSFVFSRALLPAVFALSNI